MNEARPRDQQAELERAAQEDMDRSDKMIETVDFCMYKKDFKQALDIIEPFVLDFEKSTMFSDDAVTEYHCFHEPLEELLYRHIYEPEKELRQIPIDLSNAYYVYGNLLFEMKRMDEAERVLARALKWRPTSADIAFEHAETFKIRGMIAEYEAETRKIFRFVFRPTDLARCYRNMGYCFVERMMLKEAVCCYIVSDHYERSTMAQSELYYISTKYGFDVADPSIDEVKERFAANDIPYGPDMDMMAIAYHMGKRAYDAGAHDPARYYLSIVARFVDDEDVERMLADIGDDEA